MVSTSLNIIGLIANIIGTVILAFSLSSYISSMRIAIDVHELFINSLSHSTQPVVQVTGTDVHMNRDKIRSTCFSLLGVSLVVIGFVCQLSSYLVDIIMSDILG